MTDAMERLIEAVNDALPKVGEPENVWCMLHASTLREIVAALAAAQQEAKTRGRLGKRVPWGWVYKAADGDLVWHEGWAPPDGPERWYPMYSLDTNEFPVDRQEAAAPEVRAAEPVPEPMTSTFNWFPALSAIVKIWKSPRDYRPGALDECIDSARIRLNEHQQKFPPTAPSVPVPAAQGWPAWISVADRLPTDKKEYVHHLLVANKFGSRDVCSYDGYANYFDTGHSMILGGYPVTHWLPLPAAPQPPKETP